MADNFFKGKWFEINKVNFMIKNVNIKKLYINDDNEIEIIAENFEC